MACVLAFISFVDVAVKHWETDEEGYTDQIFNTFDILVIIYQGEHFLDFSYR